MSESEVDETTAAADRWLWLYLRFIGIVSLLAFGAAVMPESWMITIAGWLGVHLSAEPLTFYLARNLSLLYGFLGVALLVMTGDLQRCGEWIGYLAVGTMAFGVGQVIVNTQAALPWWWIIGEGGAAIFGGALMWWLYRSSQYSGQ